MCKLDLKPPPPAIEHPTPPLRPYHLSPSKPENTTPPPHLNITYPLAHSLSTIWTIYLSINASPHPHPETQIQHTLTLACIHLPLTQHLVCCIFRDTPHGFAGWIWPYGLDWMDIGWTHLTERISPPTTPTKSHDDAGRRRSLGRRSIYCPLVLLFILVVLLAPWLVV